MRSIVRPRSYAMYPTQNPPRVGERPDLAGMLPRRVVVSSSLLSFLRRFAIACLVVALVATGGVLAGEAFARKSFEDSRKVHVPYLVRAQPGQPANYLLIG